MRGIRVILDRPERHYKGGRARRKAFQHHMRLQRWVDAVVRPHIPDMERAADEAMIDMLTCGWSMRVIK